MGEREERLGDSTPADKAQQIEPRGLKRPDEATHFACVRGDEGEFIMIALKIYGGVVRRAEYQTSAQPLALLCACVACRLITKRSLRTVRRFTSGAITRVLADQSSQTVRYALLASEAVHQALDSAVDGQPLSPDIEMP